ncbi:hypothetical protein [Herbaspirillum robiniae]|nr:hypothetical protein [Herbaspirillum robiniae]
MKPASSLPGRTWLAAALFMAAAGHPAQADTLTTPSFVIQIEEHCEEGVVGCDDVSYRGTHRKTGQGIALRGRTLHTLCADGVTPCRFLGYEFRNGAVRYVVLEDGTLTVTQGRKVLLEESGEWDH